MPEVRKLEFDKLVTATGIADVQIAPDGQHVIYVTSPASFPEQKPVSAIWIVPADGGAPRRLTTSEGADGAPRWSPDGRYVAFTSDRKEPGKPQLYVLDRQGGEAVRLTDQPGGVREAAWSPDGKRLAYLAAEGETEEEKKHKEEHDEKVIDEGVKFSAIWLLDLPADPAAAAELPESQRISPEGINVGSLSDAGFVWLPDGSGFVGLLAASPKAHHGFMPELAKITLDGEVQRLGTYEGAFSRPAISPDGSTIAIVAAEERMPAFFVLQTVPLAGGAPDVTMPGHESSFYSIAWLPDNERLLAIVEEGQNRSLQIADLERRQLAPAFEHPGPAGSLLGMSLTPDGKRAAYAWADDATYGEVYVADLGGASRKLTDLNPWTRDYDWGETREISWTSSDGLEIQGLLILPVGYQEGRRYPMLTHIHGGPIGAWTHHLYAGWHDWGQLLAQRGYAVFMPNPRGSSGRGAKFACGILGCYGEPDWQDIMTGVDYLIEQGIADPDKLVVGGWSGGGFLTNWTVTHTDRFKAAVSGAGISNWISFQGTADVRSVFDRYAGADVTEDVEVHWRLSPIRSIKNAVTPTLILYGEQDARVPPSQGHEMYEGLKARGVETKLVLYPGEGHGIMGRQHQLDLLARVMDWYEGHLT